MFFESLDFETRIVDWRGLFVLCSYQYHPHVFAVFELDTEFQKMMQICSKNFLLSFLLHPIRRSLA